MLQKKKSHRLLIRVTWIIFNKGASLDNIPHQILRNLFSNSGQVSKPL